jgi:hypothetical protein
MAIVSLNMGNLTVEVNTLKNKLIMGEKEKEVLQEELDKKKEFQNEYKHNVEIWKKNKVEAEKKNKVLIRNYMMIIRFSRVGHHMMKNLQNLKQKAKIWETIESKWTKALFFHKKQ